MVVCGEEIKLDKDHKKKTAALKYDVDRDQAPRIVALGSGSIAEKIIKTAKKENIPIKEDKDIVEILAKMNIGDQIPEELYTVIAEILSFFYELDELKSK